MKNPKIRFKGCTEDWEQRKFNDVFVIMQNNALSRAELSSEGGEILNVHYGDILVRYGEVLDVEKDELTYLLDSTLVSKYQSSLLQNRDIIIADAAEDETVGKCSEIAGLTTEKVLSGLHTIPCRPRMNFAEGYLGYYMNSRAYHNQLLPLIQGTKISSISKSAIQDTEIMFPKSESEQAQIGVYFRGIDHLITLHQRKCEETKKLKKYMLQKMFPKDGATVPEIRFAGFTEVWEQRKFEEFVRNVAKKNKDNLDLEPYAVTNDRGFIAQKDAHDEFGYMSNVDRTAYNIVPPKSFAYNPARINVGSLGYYEGSENVIVSSLYEVFQTEDYIDDRFLWHWLKSEHFPKWIEKLQEGSVRLYFYFDKLIQCQLMIPSYEEQHRISAYLDSIDTLITLHQRKCDELQKIKKYMLQNMFV